MAETKKPVVKSEATKAADTKTTTAITSVAAPAAKKPGRKPGAKKPGRKPAAAKKETEAKTTTAKKTAVKELLHVQFAGKTYSTEELVKIAKDVWKYDLKKKLGDFKSVELYVKPEESIVYYVINGEERGHFSI